MTNAPIHDLLIRIKNAYMARRTELTGIVYSKMAERVLHLLREYWFVSNYQITTEGKKKFFVVYLFDVVDKNQDIPVVKFYSRPWRRRYVSYKNLKPVAWWQGIGIISTSKGLLPTHIAKKEKVGGELIAEIY